jgi:hypothetical protein
MAKHTEQMHDAAWSLSKSGQEANQAMTDSAGAAQERTVQFVQGVFDNGIEVLKNHAESTRALMQELLGLPQKQQAAVQAVAESAVAAQQRNMQFAQSILQSSTELLKSHAESTRTLMQTLGEQTQKQQAAFQVLARESWDTYMGFLSAPFSYYQQVLETAESLASQGGETAQHSTRQEKQAVRATAE